jgi:hypothetical protein
MCHNLWIQHSCGHKGSYIRYVHCKYYANTLEILSKVRNTHLELRMKMNERSCKLDHRKEEFEASNELCRLCKVSLKWKAEEAEVKSVSLELGGVLDGVSEASELSYTP